MSDCALHPKRSRTSTKFRNITKHNSTVPIDYSRLSIPTLHTLAGEQTVLMMHSIIRTTLSCVYFCLVTLLAASVRGSHGGGRWHPDSRRRCHRDG
jgi:hypothetical protein